MTLATRVRPLLAVGLVMLAGAIPSAHAARTHHKPALQSFFHPAPPPTVQVTLPYSETFETGAAGWSFTGKWHVRNNPQTTQVSAFIRNYPLVTLPDDGRWPSAFDGSHVLVYSDDDPGTPEEGTFVAPWDPGAQANLNGGQSLAANAGEAVSPAIDLTDVTQAQLAMHTWYEIESVDPAPGQFDAMLVGVSVDGGDFVDVGYSGPAVDYNGNADQPATSGGFNLPGVWVEQVFDLTPYAGHVVQLRFRFQTNDELFNAFRGWFIDGVNVTSNSIEPCDVGSVSPPCSRPGLGVQVIGERFVSGSQVYIGGALATPSSVLSSTVIECTVPALPAGTYSVHVVRPDGSTCDLTNGFTIDPLHCPTTCGIESVMPGCSSPGNTPAYDIIVLGSAFQTGSVVYLGTNPCPTQVLSAAMLSFRVPSIPDGTYPLRVVSPTGLECNWGNQFIVDHQNCPVGNTRKTWGQLKSIYR